MSNTIAAVVLVTKCNWVNDCQTETQTVILRLSYHISVNVIICIIIIVL